MNTGQTILQSKRMEIFLCRLDTSLGEAARRMVEEDVSALVVVDDQGWLSGVLTRMDLMRACCQGAGWAQLPASAFMSPQVVTVTPDDPLSEAACLLVEKQIHRVVVVHNIAGHLIPVGVVSAADLLYHLVNSQAEG